MYKSLSGIVFDFFYLQRNFFALAPSKRRKAKPLSLRESKSYSVSAGDIKKG